MTPREQKLVEAARALISATTAFDGGGFWEDDARGKLLSALSAYDTTPAQEHEAMLAIRKAEDGPAPCASYDGWDGRDGGRMNLKSIGEQS